MRFELKNNTLYLIQEDATYAIPNEDIQRLVLRPGTRVLRMIDKNGETSSTPLPTAVGEIEGYSHLKEMLSKD